MYFSHYVKMREMIFLGHHYPFNLTECVLRSTEGQGRCSVPVYIHTRQHTEEVHTLIHFSHKLISISNVISHPVFCGNRSLSVLNVVFLSLPCGRPSPGKGYNCCAATGKRQNNLIRVHVGWKQTPITVLSVRRTKRVKKCSKYCC